MEKKFRDYFTKRAAAGDPRMPTQQTGQFSDVFWVESEYQDFLEKLGGTLIRNSPAFKDLNSVLRHYHSFNTTMNLGKTRQIGQFLRCLYIKYKYPDEKTSMLPAMDCIWHTAIQLQRVAIRATASWNVWKKCATCTH